MTNMIEYIFFIIIVLIFLCYGGYPIFVILYKIINTKHLFKKTNHVKSTPKEFSVVFSIHNGGNQIDKKLKNLISCLSKYQKSKIYIISDGSTDNTNIVLQHFSKNYSNIIVEINDKNIGKNMSLNKILPIIESEIIVFTDANTIYNESTFTNLLSCFSDDSIGCVVGNLTYLKGTGNKRVNDRQYWNLEKKLKMLESDSGILFAGNGALFATRKDLISTLNPALPNDLQTPLEIMNKGFAVAYCKGAEAFEFIEGSKSNEFMRRIRTINRGMNAVYRLRKTLEPHIWLLLFFRKVPRWIASFLYPLLLIINFLILEKLIFDLFFILQLLFYFVAILGLIFNMTGPISLPAYFLQLNLATIKATYHFFFGKTYITWKN